MFVPIVAVLALVAYLLWRLRQQRSMFKGLPGPPHHAIWGHFLVMREIAGSLPPDATPQLFAHLMRKRYGLGDFFYLDLWPLAPPQLVIVQPELATQIVQKMNLPKESAVMQKWTGHILGKKSMVTANGHEWLVARKSFTPGFQPRKVLQHVPGIVDDALQFAEVLKEHARNDDIFKMEDVCARMIFNISARVILGIECNAQRDDDEFLELFRAQAALAPQDFWSRYLYDISPSRHWKKWKNGRALDNYVGRIVDKRIAHGPATAPVDEKSKYFAIDDAIAIGLNNKSISGDAKASINKDTREMLIASVKTLIFAGHDTSASTLCYTYAALGKSPHILKRVREEHEALFGKDPSRAAIMLRADPALVNSLHYTLAIIKEALRLWPPTGVSLRSGQPGQTLQADGREWPTYPFAVLVNNCATMRREDLFKDSEKFYPERHLVTDPTDPYFVPKDAWRPFEKGPRTCLGQTLALVQLKIILVMTLRTFDFETVYENGTYMYQTLDVTAKPSQGLPTRVKIQLFIHTHLYRLSRSLPFLSTIIQWPHHRSQNQIFSIDFDAILRHDEEDHDIQILSAKAELQKVVRLESEGEWLDWLQSSLVKPWWAEVWRDYFTKRATTEQLCGLSEVQSRIATREANGGVKYSSFSPDKTSWGATDHLARFILMVKLENMRSNQGVLFGRNFNETTIDQIVWALKNYLVRIHSPSYISSSTGGTAIMGSVHPDPGYARDPRNRRRQTTQQKASNTDSGSRRAANVKSKNDQETRDDQNDTEDVGNREPWWESLLHPRQAIALTKSSENFDIEEPYWQFRLIVEALEKMKIAPTEARVNVELAGGSHTAWEPTAAISGNNLITDAIYPATISLITSSTDIILQSSPQYLCGLWGLQRNSPWHRNARRSVVM